MQRIITGSYRAINNVIDTPLRDNSRTELFSQKRNGPFAKIVKPIQLLEPKQAWL